MAGVTDSLINTLFDSRYRILRKLGSGGMANVYLAEDEELGRRVAIKILNERYTEDDLFIERFRREAKSAAGLSHPNIVSIYDRGEAEGTYYIAMEVIEGRSLKELIMTRGALPIDTAIAYAKQLLEALRFAHRHGIIHRDIKPHNVLVSADQQVKSNEPRLKVTDFGIARHGASQMTEAGSIMGTAQYLSPEQARGAPVTAASDLYSAGVVLYEMLTGKVPFTGDSAIEIAMKHVNDAPAPPSTLRPEISPELDQIVLRALAEDPAGRYQTAEEFIEDLERFEAGLPLSRATSMAAAAAIGGATVGEATELLSESPTRVVDRLRRPHRPRGDRPPTHRRARTTSRRNGVGAGCPGCSSRSSSSGPPWQAGGPTTRSRSSSTRTPRSACRSSSTYGSEQAMRRSSRTPGSTAEVEEQPSTEMDEGYVIEQKPEEGTRVEKGSTVTITVSSGPREVEVPRLVGLTYEDAVDALNEVNLDPRRVDVFSQKPVGQVTAQDPACRRAGRRGHRGGGARLQGRPGGPGSRRGRPVRVERALRTRGGRLRGRGNRGAERHGRRASSRPRARPQGARRPRDPRSRSRSRPGPSSSPFRTSSASCNPAPGPMIRSAGLQPSAVCEEVTDPSQNNVVLGQDPGGGSRPTPARP